MCSTSRTALALLTALCTYHTFLISSLLHVSTCLRLSHSICSLIHGRLSLSCLLNSKWHVDFHTAATSSQNLCLITWCMYAGAVSTLLVRMVSALFATLVMCCQTTRVSPPALLALSRTMGTPSLIRHATRAPSLARAASILSLAVSLRLITSVYYYFVDLGMTH